LDAQPVPAPVTPPAPAASKSINFAELRAQAAKFSQPAAPAQSKPAPVAQQATPPTPVPPPPSKPAATIPANPLPPVMRAEIAPELDTLATAVSQVQEAKAREPEFPQAKGDLKLALNKPKDFLNLAPEILHGREAYQVLQKILNVVIGFVKSKKVLQVIYNIEQSKLYVAYINYGLAMLNQSTNQKELSKEEFEAFTDFRKELDKLAM